MTTLTRRSFIRRSGSATLAGALGLGLLPSLTRKLHATDLSNSIINGVKVTWGENPQTKTETNYNGWGGTLELGCEISGVVKDSCVSTAVVTVHRWAKYTKNGASGTAEETRTFTWKCVDGAPSVEAGEGTYVSSAPVGNSGFVYMEPPTPSGSSLSMTAKVFNNATNEFSPDLPLSMAGYSVTCCVIV